MSSMWPLFKGFVARNTRELMNWVYLGSSMFQIASGGQQGSPIPFLSLLFLLSLYPECGLQAHRGQKSTFTDVLVPHFSCLILMLAGEFGKEASRSDPFFPFLCFVLSCFLASLLHRLSHASGYLLLFTMERKAS